MRKPALSMRKGGGFTNGAANATKGMGGEELSVEGQRSSSFPLASSRKEELELVGVLDEMPGYMHRRGRSAPTC